MSSGAGAAASRVARPGAVGVGGVQDEHAALGHAELGEGQVGRVRGAAGGAERPVVAVGLGGDVEKVGHQLLEAHVGGHLDAHAAGRVLEGDFAGLHERSPSLGPRWVSRLCLGCLAALRAAASCRCARSARACQLAPRALGADLSGVRGHGRAARPVAL